MLEKEEITIDCQIWDDFQFCSPHREMQDYKLKITIYYNHKLIFDIMICSHNYNHS